MEEHYSFIPGARNLAPGPIDRYIPIVDEGIASAWISKFLVDNNKNNKKDWILDPFGSSPTLVKEIAQTGYPTLVVSPNPILHYLIEKSIKPVDRHDLLSALAQFRMILVGAQRLEIFIKNLYKTQCNRCNSEIIASAFIWDLDENIPIIKVYECNQCAERGEFPTSAEDISYAKSFRPIGLHQSWLVEKAIYGNQTLRKSVEGALYIYLPRALSAIFTLLTSLEQMPENLIDPLNYLLIPTFDKANTLWHYPPTKIRPKLLIKPSRFYEHNIWLALEDAIETCSQHPITDSEINLCNWPELPKNNSGVCLYENKILSFKREINHNKNLDLPIEAIITTIPRYNQAFWTLSAIWSGWLFGKEATSSFITILRRRRYDWTWHSSALKSIFSSCTDILKHKTPIFGIISELEPSFFSAAVFGAINSGIRHLGYAARVDTKEAQLHWVYDPRHGNGLKEHSSEYDEQELDDLIYSAINKQILNRNEPTNYQNIHTAVIDAIAKIPNNDLFRNIPQYMSLGFIHNKIQDILTESKHYIRYDGSTKNINVGYWWLNNYEPSSNKTHTDLVEESVANQLYKGKQVQLNALDRAICSSFPGDLTPDKLKIMICLETYGDLQISEEGLWKLRNNENPIHRKADIDEITTLIILIGKNLGYTVLNNIPQNILWSDEYNHPKYQFFIINHAYINETIHENMTPGTKNIMVIPGGRANLILFKLNQNPRLRDLVNDGWTFMKFRQVRKLSAVQSLTRDDFAKQLNTDPLIYQNPQIPLF